MESQSELLEYFHFVAMGKQTKDFFFRPVQVLQNGFSVQVAVCHILSKPVLACPIKLNEIIVSCITAPLPGDWDVIRIE